MKNARLVGLTQHPGSSGPPGRANRPGLQRRRSLPVPPVPAVRPARRWEFAGTGTGGDRKPGPTAFQGQPGPDPEVCGGGAEPAGASFRVEDGGIQIE